MATFNAKDCAYIRLNFRGYIPILDVYGPIRAAWVPKEDIKALIRNGYDVDFVNKDACPEFYAQIQEYRRLLAAKDFVGAKKVFGGALDVDKNSAAAKALSQMGVNPDGGNGGSIPPVTQPQNTQNPSKKQKKNKGNGTNAAASALEAMGEQVNPQVETGLINPELPEGGEIDGGDYSDQMSDIMSETTEDAGSSEENPDVE